MDEEPEIISRSLADARREIPDLTDDAAVVSIGSPQTDPPEGVDPEHPRHLRLEFDDVLSPSDGFTASQVHPPQRSHIEQLVDRSDDLLAADLVYCHCAAGISRSTAAAFILECRRRGTGAELDALQRIVRDNPFASPNRRMVEFADELMERNGAMVEALATVTRSPHA